MILLGGFISLGYLTFSTDTILDRENAEANQWRIGYWNPPIPLQGDVPEKYHPLAQNIQAADCGECHPDIYQEWSQALHSKAMGSGVAGQYSHFNGRQMAECNICHAPMSEQWSQLKQINGTWIDNENFDKSLQQEGVNCSACHLREHQYNGPPLRPGKESQSQDLHGEPVRTPFFQTSEFCRGCHQHETNTLKIGGKTIQNTYIEWLQSPAYEEGKTCQHCHMPDRKHLLKGIHDKPMTASGVTIEYSLSSQQPKVGSPFEATLTIKNTGTGHMFPTYTTPAVLLKAAFLDAAGKIISKQYYEELIIQRRLNLSTSPWTEYFDTRLAPEEYVTLEFEKTVPPEAKNFKLWIWVEPDNFYELFYRTVLRNSPNHKGKKQLEEALQATIDRQYSLFSKDLRVLPENDDS